MPDYVFYCEVLLSQTERAWTEEELETFSRIVRRDVHISDRERTLLLERIALKREGRLGLESYRAYATSPDLLRERR